MARRNPYRHDALANERDRQYLIEIGDRLPESRPRAPKQPPRRLAEGRATRQTDWTNRFSDPMEWSQIGRGFALGPAIEVDDPAGGGGVGSGVEVLTIQV